MIGIVLPAVPAGMLPGGVAGVPTGMLACCIAPCIPAGMLEVAGVTAGTLLPPPPRDAPSDTSIPAFEHPTNIAAVENEVISARLLMFFHISTNRA